MWLIIFCKSNFLPRWWWLHWLSKRISKVTTPLFFSWCLTFAVLWCYITSRILLVLCRNYNEHVSNAYWWWSNSSCQFVFQSPYISSRYRSKVWEVVGILTTQGQLDLAKTIDLLDKHAEAPRWAQSLLGNNIFFNSSKLPRPLKVTKIVQKPGDLVLIFGAPHQG